MDSHLVADSMRRGRAIWVEDFWKFEVDITAYLTKKAFEEVVFLMKEEFIQWFGDWNPRIKLGW